MPAVAVVFVLGGAGHAAAKPYDDTRGRFHLDLPDEWSVSPLFGDTQGMRFASGPASVWIHVDAAQGSLEDYARATELELSREQDVKAAPLESKARIGSPALSRGYRVRGEDGERLIEVHFAAIDGHLYRVRLERPLRAKARVKRELELILSSFRPGHFQERTGPEAKGGESNRTLRPAEDLTGRWLNDDGVLIVLSPDGRFTMDALEGRFEADERNLTLIIPGQGRESFRYALDRKRGKLAIDSPNLERPSLYTLQTSSAPPAGAGGAGPPGPEAISESQLVGRWRSSKGTGALLLVLEAGGRFELQGSRGTWSLEGSSLKLMRTRAEGVTYTVGLRGDLLILDGGDLDEALEFRRAGSG